MNALIKTALICFLAISALFIWITCILAGFCLSFTSNFAFMYDITPFIGLVGVICIIRAIISVYTSNPIGYLNGKAKI